ncbi:MAG: glycerophosphodiester phosphodiesterase [Fidelibacterota bacterium]
MRNNLKIVWLGLLLVFGASCARVDNRIITAHRGASGTAPENTMIAIQRAIELGAGFSEIDVQETADGEIILLHDKTLERTGGVVWNIWDTPYDSLKKIEVGSWFAPEYAGEPVPRLADVIDAVKGKIKLNIELKINGHEKELVEKVVDLIHEKKFQSECIVTSFDLQSVQKVRQLDKNLKVGLIFSKYPENVDVFSLDVDLLSVKYTLVDEEFMRKARASGKDVHVWTVNDSEMMQKLLDLGVTSIITNYPGKLRTLI